MYGKFNTFEANLTKITMAPVDLQKRNIGLMLSNDAFAKYM